MKMSKFWAVPIVSILVFLFLSMYVDYHIDQTIDNSLEQTQENVLSILNQFSIESDLLVTYHQLIPVLQKKQQMIDLQIAEMRFHDVFASQEKNLITGLADISNTLRSIKTHNDKIEEFLEKIEENPRCLNTDCSLEELKAQTELIRRSQKFTEQGNQSIVLLLADLHMTDMRSQIELLDTQLDCENPSELATDNICWHVLFIYEHQSQLADIQDSLENKSTQSFDTWQRLSRLQSLLNKLEINNKKLQTILTSSGSTFEAVRNNLQEQHRLALEFKQESQEPPFQVLIPEAQKLVQFIREANQEINRFRQDESIKPPADQDYKQKLSREMQEYQEFILNLHPLSFRESHTNNILINMKTVLELRQAISSYITHEQEVIESKEKIWNNILPTRDEKDLKAYEREVKSQLDEALQFLHKDFKHDTNLTLDDHIDENLDLFSAAHIRGVTISPARLKQLAVDRLINLTSRGMESDIGQHEEGKIFTYSSIIIAMDPSERDLVSDVRNFNSLSEFEKEDIYLHLLSLDSSED